jgi:hypothetical protein
LIKCVKAPSTTGNTRSPRGMRPRRHASRGAARAERGDRQQRGEYARAAWTRAPRARGGVRAWAMRKERSAASGGNRDVTVRVPNAAHTWLVRRRVARHLSGGFARAESPSGEARRTARGDEPITPSGVYRGNFMRSEETHPAPFVDSIGPGAFPQYVRELGSISRPVRIGTCSRNERDVTRKLNCSLWLHSAISQRHVARSAGKRSFQHMTDLESSYATRPTK